MTLPQDIEAEKAVLGSMLAGGEPVIVKVMAILTDAGMYAVPSHQQIHTLVATMTDSRQPVDLVTCRNAAIAEGTLDKIGGVEYLVQLVESFPNASHAEHYAQIVKRAADLRSLYKVGHELTTATCESEADPQALAATVMDSISKIEAGTRPDAPELSSDIFDEVMAEIESRDDSFVPYWRTCLGSLDDIIGGFRPGKLVVVAGRPSMGKTALATHILTSMSGPELPCTLLSLEMTRAEIMQRILARLAGVDSRDIQSARGRDAEMVAQLKRYRGEVRRMQLRIVDTCGRSQSGGRTLNYMMAVIRRHVYEYGVRVVCVDYLQLLDIPGNRESRAFRVQQMTAAFKALALELGICIVIVCQLNRELSRRSDTRPQMSDLRESGAIEQDADVILLVHRPAYYLPFADVRAIKYCEAIVAKNRDGGTGVAALRWTARFQQFESMDAEEAQRCKEILEPKSAWKTQSPVEEQTEFTPF